MTSQPSAQAALRGEPSYVWRAGQQRRLEMIQKAARDRLKGVILEDGCGVGSYLQRFAKNAKQAIGLEVEFPRCVEAHQLSDQVICGVGETLPFPDNRFDLILSHEVLEHVKNDRLAVSEIVRTLKPGGRLVLFVPNRGYPFETHGIYRQGKYHFGNKLFVNWLPRVWRDKLAPHVRVYSKHDLVNLFQNLSVKIIEKQIIFGAYDNIIARRPKLGGLLRSFLQWLERTPFRIFGLSHFWVIEKV